jgi:uncharacterized protein (TIGR03084 family)
MREILADLVAEQQGLDQLLQRVPDRVWRAKTPAAGWTVQDTIGHLAWSEEAAARVLSDDPDIASEYRAAGSLDAFNDLGITKARKLRPQAVIEWWRHQRAAVVDNLSRRSPGERIPWIAGSLSARTFATARLAETWAHGLDIHVALEREPVDTPRLRHVAWLGWATLPHAFATAGMDYPSPIRVELVGPGYARWVFGPEEADDVVRGNAGDWCRVVVRRLDPKDVENLTASGERAAEALRVACTWP